MVGSIAATGSGTGTGAITCSGAGSGTITGSVATTGAGADPRDVFSGLILITNDLI
jgi:hypothetical protein